MKQCNLNGANSSCCFHHVTKNSESEEHGVEAVKITSYDKGSVTLYRLRQDPSGHSQYKYEEVYYECGEIQYVPSITETKNGARLCEVINEVFPGESTVP